MVRHVTRRTVGQGGPAGAGLDGLARGASAAVAGTRPWLGGAARIGYAARGLVYVTLGLLSLQTAVEGGRTEDQRGAIVTLAEQPAGQLLVLLVGIGLLGYAAWRVVEAITDGEGAGVDGSGLAKRALHAGSGIAHALLTVFALRLLAGDAQSRAGGGPEGWTARLLAMPAGRWLVIAVGLGVIGYALAQLRKAWTARLDEMLDLSAVGATERRWIVRAGRAGIGARGVVFAIIGGFLVLAAWRHDPSRAGGLDEALAALAGAPFGATLLAVVAIGLVAFGAFQFVRARYRRVAVA